MKHPVLCFYRRTKKSKPTPVIGEIFDIRTQEEKNIMLNSLDKPSELTTNLIMYGAKNLTAVNQNIAFAISNTELTVLGETWKLVSNISFNSKYGIVKCLMIAPINGTELLKNFLLAIKNDPSIYWITTMGEHCWRNLSKESQDLYIQMYDFSKL